MPKAVGVNISGLSGERWPAKKETQSAETKLSFTHLSFSGLKKNTDQGGAPFIKCMEI